MVVISVYTSGVKIIKKFRWESGFLWGVPWNPLLCTNGNAGYLMQLSVKIAIMYISSYHKTKFALSFSAQKCTQNVILCLLKSTGF